MIRNAHTSQGGFAFDPNWNGHEIADAIITHAIDVLASGSAVDLDQYLGALADRSVSSPEPIVATMAAGLRDLARSGATLDEAESLLRARYPEHAEWIQEAVEMDRVFRSSTVEHFESLERPSIEFPGECGPRIPEQRLRRYRLIKQAGAGSNGVVVYAEDRLLGSTDKPAGVAIKFLRPHPFRDLGIQREAIKARRVNDAGVVRVLDCGLDAERDLEYAVFEWVEGGTLEHHIDTHPELSVAARVKLIERIAHGLQALHDARLIHCDLKPANILIAQDGTPKIADVGTSQLSMQSDEACDIGAAGGTPAFMAPEQIKGHAPTARFDVYALGTMLAWALSGKSVAGTSVAQIDRFHASRRDGASLDLPPEVDPVLCRIIDRAMAHAPAQRYNTPSDIADDLRHWRESVPIEWTQPSLLSRLKLATKRRPRISITITLSCMLISAGLMQWHRYEVRDARVDEWESRRSVLAQQYSGMAEHFAHADLPIANGLAGLWTLHVLSEAGVVDEVFDSNTTLEGLVELASRHAASAPAGSFNAALWHLQCGYWMLAVDGPPPSGTESHLMLALEYLQRTVSSDDLLHTHAEALLACAHVKRMWYELRASGNRSPFQRDRAARLTEALEISLERIMREDEGSAVHELVLRSLRHLYGVHMLQDLNNLKRIMAFEEAVAAAY